MPVAAAAVVPEAAGLPWDRDPDSVVELVADRSRAAAAVAVVVADTAAVDTAVAADTVADTAADTIADMAADTGAAAVVVVVVVVRKLACILVQLLQVCSEVQQQQL